MWANENETKNTFVYMSYIKLFINLISSNNTFYLRIRFISFDGSTEAMSAMRIEVSSVIIKLVIIGL